MSSERRAKQASHNVKTIVENRTLTLNWLWCADNIHKVGNSCSEWTLHFLQSTISLGLWKGCVFLLSVDPGCKLNLIQLDLGTTSDIVEHRVGYNTHTHSEYARTTGRF